MAEGERATRKPAGTVRDAREGPPPAPGPRAFVTGWPVSHSRSPLIHRGWLEGLRLAGSYEPVAVPPEAFGAFLAGLRAAGFAGGNVTIPHKEAAFRLVARRDRAAAAIGAVNTLWFEGDTLVGGNTDAYGFSANLDERLAGWRGAEEAVVLGAGGAARAVVHALLEAGVRRVAVLNRTPARADAIAAAFGPKVEAHGEDAAAALLARADLLVNTRPVAAATAAAPGGSPAETPLPDLSALPDGALVTDIVYVPLRTPTLAAAAGRGLCHADGLGMLLHQAVPGFERWFGHRPTVDEALRERIKGDIDAAS